MQGEGGEQGSGGAGPSSGGTDSSGGSGGAPSDGGSGNTSTDGGGGSGTSGGFSSIWQAESAELMIFDVTSSAGFESHTLEMPAKMEAPGDDREVEFYLQFEGESRITYAYTDGDPAYYRFSEPAYSFGDFYSMQTADGSHSYSIEDGKLTDTAQQSFGSTYSAITTTKYKKVDEFPPSDWPSKVVSYEMEGVQ